MMVTGDYHHTAIAIARGVSMIPERGRVVIIQAKKQRRQVSPVPHAVTEHLLAVPFSMSPSAVNPQGLCGSYKDSLLPPGSAEKP